MKRTSTTKKNDAVTREATIKNLLSKIRSLEEKRTSWPGSYTTWSAPATRNSKTSAST